jgi:hypothetical protein
MIFMIPVNKQTGEESVTYMRVDVGNVTNRIAKRKLRIVLTEWGIPKDKQSIFVKELFSKTARIR